MIAKKNSKKKVAKKTVKKTVKQLINKTMTIGDVAEKYPQAVEIMGKYGLHCIGCHVSPFESIEQGCMAHGLNSSDIDKMVKEMNEKIGKKK